jgi:hypothetical protein
MYATDPTVPQYSRYGIMELWNYGIMELWNYQIDEFVNIHIINMYLYGNLTQTSKSIDMELSDSPIR